jgi:ubiquinone/menaquinone biosynthesis C-methylase UbiE
MTDWWLDEVAHAGREHLDDAYVAGYERKAGFDPAEDLDVLSGLGLGADSTVIDIGAGVGTFALAAARRCREVIAVDVSPAMTAVLRKRAEQTGAGNVTVVDAGFLSYEHRGAPVEFAYSRHALHQLPDFWKGIALRRLADTLRPGGILRLRDLAYDFGPADADQHIDAWLSGAVTDAALGWTADELAEHVRIEFSTYSWLLEQLLQRAGFEILDCNYHGSIYGASTCRSVT